jgi:hypothetical protein
MALAVYPVGAVRTAPNAYSVTMPAADTLYESPMSLIPGVYTCTCISSTITYIDFIDSEGAIHKQVQTLSGTIVTAISSSISKVRVSTDTGTNIVISIQLTANPEGATVAPTLGTVEELTTTGTYTSTSTSGFALAVVVGGGAGGGQPGPTGAGGGSGGVACGVVVLNGSRSYTIGAAGNAANPNGNAGGTTTIGNITATGGQPASASTGGAGGTPRGGAGGNTGSPGGYMPTGFESTRHPYQFVKAGTTGGGAGSRNDSTSPSGSGIGTGAAGNNGWAATGFGSAGGHGGGNGRPGAIFLKRF